MLSLPFNIVTSIVIGLTAGLLVLFLVANELGKRAGLAAPARLLLACGLGMGVIAFGIKLAIIATISNADKAQLAGRNDAQERAPKHASIEPPAPPVETGPGPLAQGYRIWRPLPETPPIPRNNPMTPEKIELGRKLFNDTGLSANGSVSCASCHNLREGGDDNKRYSHGVDGKTGDRNAPTVYNAAFLERLFWDGRASSLEKQASGPLTNPLEMAMPSMKAVRERINEQPEYRAEFASAFPGKNPVTATNIIKAIAAFERTLVTTDTPYDRFVRGDDFALPENALRGMALFDDIGCRSCHIDPVFSAAGTEKPLGIFRMFPVYTNNNPYPEKYGLLMDGESSRYRVPSLRNVAVTAPYFHNGSVSELEEAIRVMAVSQLGLRLDVESRDDILVLTRMIDSDEPGRNMSVKRGRFLTEAQISDIAAFLRALTASDLEGY